jgi:putative ABC transport system permease protein
MLKTIAWRNIWRSRTRSAVVIGAITLGVWALIFIVGWMSGMINMYVSSIINNQTSHIQIHSETYLKERKNEFIIENSTKIISELRHTEGIKAVVPRIVTNGIANSPRASKGVLIRGINPEGEAAVTNLAEQVKQGKYFDDETRNPVIIGEALAEKLKVSVGKKITLQFQDMDGELTGQAYRIIGLYKSGNTQLDELIVFARQNDLSTALKNGDNVHEIALLVDNFDETYQMANNLKKVYPNLAVQTYDEVAPSLKLFESQIGATSKIITFIVMIALIFGIINTMLMAVLERVKELGVLMAIGMNKAKIFSMIVLETLMLSMVGLPIGVFLGWLTMNIMGKRGIDLSAYEESLEEYGMSSIIYPSIDSSYYITIAIAVFFTALLASIYPALKATRLKPVEAINKI